MVKFVVQKQRIRTGMIKSERANQIEPYVKITERTSSSSSWMAEFYRSAFIGREKGFQ